MVIWHLKQIENVKKLDNGASWTDCKSKKPSFWNVISYSTQYWTTSRSDSDTWQKVDFIKQLATTSSVVGRRRCSKNTSQNQTCTKNGHGNCFGGLLSVWSTTFFWIPANSLHLRSMLSKSMKCTKNCNTCSHYWSTEWTQFSTMPDCKFHNQQSKSWTNWAMKFYLICHIYLTSLQPTTTSSSISTTFCQENASTTNRRQKMLSKNSSNPKTCIFMLQEQTNSFLIGTDVLTVMVPILINKDVFEPHFNTLKFTVWNHNYFCTNLILTNKPITVAPESRLFWSKGLRKRIWAQLV